MNIVVIGSCTDSSNLAKELNKRLSSSIVARIDLLKNIKQLVLQNVNVNTNENLGTYIGDVETFDAEKLSDTLRQQVSTTMLKVMEDVTALRKGSVGPPIQVSTFDALTSGFPGGTYSFIKVYSGAINDAYVTSLRSIPSFVQGTVFVVIKSPKGALLPVTVSKRMLEGIKKEAFAYVECNEVKDVLATDVFQMLFELTSDKNKPKVEEKVDAESPLNIQHGAVFAPPPVMDMVVGEMLADAA